MITHEYRELAKDLVIHIGHVPIEYHQTSNPDDLDPDNAQWWECAYDLRKRFEQLEGDSQ